MLDKSEDTSRADMKQKLFLRGEVHTSGVSKSLSVTAAFTYAHYSKSRGQGSAGLTRETKWSEEGRREYRTM